MLFTYSKMAVLDCLISLTLSAVGNDDRMFRNKFVVVCKCPGAGTLSTVKCPLPGAHCETNARGLPGGGKCTRLELTRTLLACTNLVTLIFQAISAANGQWKLPWRRAVALFNVSELWFLEYSPSSSYVGEYSPTIHLHFREQLIIVIIIIVFITVLFLLIINVLLIAIIIHFII